MANPNKKENEINQGLFCKNLKNSFFLREDARRVDLYFKLYGKEKHKVKKQNG